MEDTDSADSQANNPAQRRRLGMIIALIELVPQNDKRLALLEILRFVEEYVQGKAG